ncbi:unnamed protein product [Lupinus luteus]|uniref:Myb-like domain-containing protein n=1 Tax=Lupinus luteus TaxID=3873 RepID=A0AAV1XEY7_LUPLU
MGQGKVQNANTETRAYGMVHDKAFERAIVMFPYNTPNRWEKMTHHVPGNWSSKDLRQRYEKLEHEVFTIVSSQYEFPEL